MSDIPKQVKIVEVGPRDGLQNEPHPVPSNVKVEFINRLSETGLSHIEVTSFVSAKWIPQLADAKEVFQGITKAKEIAYPVLVPNEQGLQDALVAGASEISVFTAASETFSNKNTNCSIEESLKRIEAILKICNQQNLKVRAYISTVLGCPYEGEISPQAVVKLADALFKMGCYEISLGDTIGVGTPLKTKKLIEAVSQKVPTSHLAAHYHDTYGQALANLYASLEMGISVIDSSIAGLGGCPYARGASGNVATEDVLYMLQGMGIDTGIDLKKLLETSRFVTEQLGHPARSKVALAYLAKNYPDLG